jgi:hypothetical protein
MKKLFTILCAGLLTLGVSAQKFGATAGLNMANITDIDDSKMRLGIRLGASFSTELSDVMTLQSGLLYSVKGVAYESTVDIDQSLGYIEIPFGVKFAVSDQFSLDAGLYSAFLISSVVTVDGESSDSDTEGLNTIDFGIGLGASFSATDAISINLGYQMGLNTVVEDADEGKNTNILVGVTYNFGG